MTIPASADGTPADANCPRCEREVGPSWIVCAWCGEDLAAPAELPVGATVGDGRYQVLGVIGRGGFGITYEVGDRRLRRRVAMKELFPDTAVRHGTAVVVPVDGRDAFEVARDRFMREARVLARFTHTGIVRVYEVFEANGTAYLVMELVDGRTLVDLLQQHGRPFPEATVLDVAGRIAAALRPVHAAGVLHRDVNPSNVMLTRHGRIVVIDFGLARDYDPDSSGAMTRVVTPGYAPLEQYRGEGRFGPSTDVYGLAATCYRLVTGRVPTAAVERSAGADLRSPASLNPLVSRQVSDGILDGLELEPGHRPQDLDSFLARLGIPRLPDGPRSTLLDLVPIAEGDRRGGSPPVAPVAAPDGPGSAQTPTVAGCVEVFDGGHHDPDRESVPEGDLTVHEPLMPREQGDDPTFADPMPQAPVRYVDPTIGAAPLRRADATATAVAGPLTDPRATRQEPAGQQFRFVDGVARPVTFPQRGRRKVLLPIGVAAAAIGSAAPLPTIAVMVLVLLPLLATMGDSAAHRSRGISGEPGGWAERRLSVGALAAPRLVRNIVVSAGRAVPLLVMTAVAMGVHQVLARSGVPDVVPMALLRFLGAGVCGALALGAARGSARFRSGLGTDEMVQALTPAGRSAQRFAVLWIVTTFVVAASIWLTPSPFPFN